MGLRHQLEEIGPYQLRCEGTMLWKKFQAGVVSSGKGTGNTNQYTQHKRHVVLVRGLRDKRENHVTSGIGLVSRSRVSPVYNQEREN